MELNLNMLFDKLTNFKIKFTEKPSPTQVSNADLYFFFKGERVEFNTIFYDDETEIVVVEFEEMDNEK